MTTVKIEDLSQGNPQVHAGDSTRIDNQGHSRFGMVEMGVRSGSTKDGEAEHWWGTHSDVRPALRLMDKFTDVGGAGRIYQAVAPNGQKVWVKEVLGDKFTFKRNVSSKVVNAFVRHPLLRRVAYMNPQEGLRVEAAWLKAFASKNILVPKLLVEHENYLVLSDVGQGVHEVLSQNGAGAGDVAGGVVSKLGEMHQMGVAHGDAIIKNFTHVAQVGLVDSVDKGRAGRGGTFDIGVIDLEGTPDFENGFHSFAAGDVWAMCYSLVRGYGGAHFAQKDVVSGLVSDYFEQIPVQNRTQVAQDLRFLSNSLSGTFASALKGIRVHKTVGWHLKTKEAVLAAV